MIAALTHEELQFHLALAEVRGWDEIAYDVRKEMERRVEKREAEMAEQ